MVIGVYQFPVSGDMECNFSAIRRAVKLAAQNGVRFLLFPECALTGYPPFDLVSAAQADFARQAGYVTELKKMAIEQGMYLAVGGINRRGDACYNALNLFAPQGELAPYEKRALYGYDADNFVPGESDGLYEIDGIKIGLRICFEVRFPEYFRELYRERADLCVVSFRDSADEDDAERYQLIRSHLRTRAVENVMTVISVNSCGRHQTAPTGVYDQNGAAVQELERGREGLLVFDFTVPEESFGMAGRRLFSDRLTGR